MNKVIVLLLLVFAISCSDDTTSPEGNSIVGEWKMEYTGEMATAYDELTLDINNDGKFITTLVSQSGKVEELEHQYTYRNDTFTIWSVECEGGKGNYKLEFKDNGFEIEVIDEECETRDFLFVGYYEKQED